MLKFIFVSYTLLLISCSSQQLVLDSTPSGADVYAQSEEKVGQTPLTLTDSVLEKVTSGDKVHIRLLKEGFSTSELVTELNGLDKYNIKLKPLDATHFQKNVLNYYQDNYNEMIRDVLMIQGLLVSRQRNQAEKTIESFIKRYPNVAAGYVMKANLALLKGKKSEARSLLIRAKNIDPDDPVVKRLLGGGSRQPTGSVK